MKASFWKHKKVLLVPAHGELASWVLLLLHRLGAHVSLAGQAPTQATFFDQINGAQLGNLSFGSFVDLQFWQQVFQSAQPEVCLFLNEHSGPSKPLELNIFLNEQIQIQTAFLQAFSQSDSSGLVWLSSDRIYAKQQGDIFLSERSPVQPEDAASSIAFVGETLLASYRQQFFRPDKFNKHKKSATVIRTSAGVGPSVSQSSLLSQCAEALNAERVFEIKKPFSVRPWIHYLDQAGALLLAAENLSLKGPKASPVINVAAEEYEAVGEVIQEFTEAWGPGKKDLLQGLGTAAGLSLHRRLSTDLAREELGWQVQLSLSQTLQSTAHWYRAFLQGADAGFEVEKILHSYIKQSGV